MALPEEKPWVSLNQEAFLLLTHVAKGSRKFLLVHQQQGRHNQEEPGFQLSATNGIVARILHFITWTQINDKPCQKGPSKGNSLASQTRRELYLFQQNPWWPSEGWSHMHFRFNFPK